MLSDASLLLKHQPQPFLVDMQLTFFNKFRQNFLGLPPFSFVCKFLLGKGR